MTRVPRPHVFVIPIARFLFTRLGIRTALSPPGLSTQGAGKEASFVVAPRRSRQHGRRLSRRGCPLGLGPFIFVCCEYLRGFAGCPTAENESERPHFWLKTLGRGCRLPMQAAKRCVYTGASSDNLVYLIADMPTHPTGKDRQPRLLCSQMTAKIYLSPMCDYSASRAF